MVSASCCSAAQSFLTLFNPADCSMLGLPAPHHLPKYAQVHVHCIGDAIQPSHPLYPLLLLPSIFPSLRKFSNEFVVRIRWPKYWSFNFSISHSNEYSGLISFKIGWLISSLSNGLSGDFSSTVVQRHQFFSAVPSLLSSSHNPTRPLWRPQPWLYGCLLAAWCLCFSTHC